MGLAASQARYLALTARKTNTEYEGQQINQERTALANQAADTFNSYLALEVPTAPSTTDFTTIQYSFSDGLIEENIEKMTDLNDSSSEYNYIVDYFHYADVYTGVLNNKVNPQVRTEIIGGAQIPTYVGNCECKVYVRGEDTMLDLALDQIQKDNPNERIASIDPSTPNSIYTYEQYGRTYFATLQELLESANSPRNTANPSEFQQKDLNVYYADAIKTKISAKEKAFIEFDETGRATSINLEHSSAKYVVSTNTVTDDAAYQDAMNQYMYDKAKYEKAVADINARTEIIQQEDRTLELRLRQLDTEQQALQTEMEAVAKVIDKNIESTFKTFGN